MKFQLGPTKKIRRTNENISIFLSFPGEVKNSIVAINFRYISSVVKQLRVIRRLVSKLLTVWKLEINPRLRIVAIRPDLTCNTCNELHREISWKDEVLTCSKLTRS